MADQFTLARVRASYTPERAWLEMSGELPAYLLYRPLSFWLTVPLLRLGVRAGFITGASAVIAVSLPLIAAIEPEGGFLAIGLLALVFHVFDCVDGNLARSRGTSSASGALFDALVDQAFWCALFSALGMLVAHTRHALAPYAMMLSLGCALLVLAGRRIRDEARLLSGERVELSTRRPERVSPLSWAIIVLAGLENLYALAILVCGFYGLLPELLLAIAVYVAGIYLASLLLSFLRVRGVR